MVKTNGYAFSVAQATECKTSREIAELSGVSLPVIYKIANSYKVRAELVGKVAKALNIPAGDLISEG